MFCWLINHLDRNFIVSFSLIKKYPQTKFSCLTDNIGAANEQSREFQKNGLIVPVYIDLNVGMNRTGICPR